MTTTATSSVQLHRSAADSLELPAAIGAVFGERSAIAMLHGLGPSIGDYQAGTVSGPGGPLDLSNVYRADVFDSTHHLRWYRPQGASSARAVVVTEKSQRLDGFDEHQAVECLTNDRHDLLWPALEPHAIPNELPDGWRWAGSGRTAGFAVPTGHSGELRTGLAIREYTVVDPAVTDELDGNAYVIDERFRALEGVRLEPPVAEPSGDDQ
jgi:hypothetical protein